jgi:hypothetical protein
MTWPLCETLKLFVPEYTWNMSGEGHDNGNDKKSRERERFGAALKVPRRQNNYGRAVSQQVFGTIQLLQQGLIADSGLRPRS